MRPGGYSGVLGGSFLGPPQALNGVATGRRFVAGVGRTMARGLLFVLSRLSAAAEMGKTTSLEALTSLALPVDTRKCNKGPSQNEHVSDGEDKSPPIQGEHGVWQTEYEEWWCLGNKSVMVEKMR